MTQFELAVENASVNIAHWLWFATIGGVIQCGKDALHRDHLKALEFACAIALMLMGAWLFIPHDGSTMMPFTQTMQQPILGTVFYVPLWLSALLYIIIARFMIHATFSKIALYRWVGLTISSMTWAIMLFFNWLSAYNAAGNLFIIAVLTCNYYLMVQANKEVKEIQIKEAQQKE